MLTAAAFCGGMHAAQAETSFGRLVCPKTQDNPRNGAGSVLALRDGSLLMSYTKFTGGGKDNDAAYIAGKTSSDGSATWSEDFVLQPNDAGMNVMSSSLLRLQSGKLLLGYLRKNSGHDCRVYFRLSSDEGKTWGEERLAQPSLKYGGYHVQNNDRMIQLSTGRILSPVALNIPDWFLVCFVFYSDDEGATWHRSRSFVQRPTVGGAGEPGVVELKDGRVMMVFRSYGGYVGRAFSSDAGVTWSEGEMVEQLPAPQSPQTVKRIPSTGDLLLVWNHNPTATVWGYGEPSEWDSEHKYGTPVPSEEARRRNPLTSAISRDEGQTWAHMRNIEEGPSGQYAYTSIAFLDDDVLLTYTGPKGVYLKRLPVTWFYGQ